MLQSCPIHTPKISRNPRKSPHCAKCPDHPLRNQCTHTAKGRQFILEQTARAVRAFICPKPLRLILSCGLAIFYSIKITDVRSTSTTHCWLPDHHFTSHFDKYTVCCPSPHSGAARNTSSNTYAPDGVSNTYGYPN
jgi:hypothetical protein